MLPSSEVAPFVAPEAESSVLQQLRSEWAVRELLLALIPVQTPPQRLLILLQSQLSPYALTAFITLPGKDLLPVLTIINFTSPCTAKGFCWGPVGASAETRLGRARAVLVLLEGEPRLCSMPGYSRWGGSRRVLATLM